MEDKLYIVVWRISDNRPWQAQHQGVFPERRMAENLIECLKVSGEHFEFAIIEGPITSPAEMEAQATKMGEF